MSLWIYWGVQFQWAASFLGLYDGSLICRLPSERRVVSVFRDVHVHSP
jgi:hypothetical protein